MKHTRFHCGVVGALAVVLAISITATPAFAQPQTQPQTQTQSRPAMDLGAETAEAVVERYLAALKALDGHEAYACLGADTRESFTPDDLDSVLKDTTDEERIESYKIESIDVDRERTSISVTITYNDGTVEDVTFSCVLEGTVWVIADHE